MIVPVVDITAVARMALRVLAAYAGADCRYHSQRTFIRKGGRNRKAEPAPLNSLFYNNNKSLASQNLDDSRNTILPGTTEMPPTRNLQHGAMGTCTVAFLILTF
ncbi:hypothetical protein QR685DRAFT_599998 [Neurospora intermedia]|uniref:Uncharacterized protein n=1 Tax=Neurospora intermedia TaxID=5142 RepID=A0ABR3D4S8_NEUIN